MAGARSVCLGAAALLFALHVATTPFARAGRGGPDAGGWVWEDSNEPGMNNRIENFLSSTVELGLWPDEWVAPVTLPFPFTLYGTTSSTVWVSSNGWIALSDPLGNAAPVDPTIPTGGIPEAMLAYYWDDLDGGGSSYLIHGPTPSGYLFLVRHNHKATNALIQIFIQFNRNNSVKVMWQAIPATQTATIGIENGTGTIGTELIHDGAAAAGFSLKQDYAVFLHPQSKPACATATPLNCGASLAGDTRSGGSNALGYSCGTAGYTGKEVVYSVSLAAPAKLDLNLTSATNQHIFLLRAGCEGFSDCIAGGAKTLSMRLLGAGTYYVVVDGQTAGDDGPFTLAATCGAPAGTTVSCGDLNRPADNLGADGKSTYDCSPGPVYTTGEAYYLFRNTVRSKISVSHGDPANYDLFAFRGVDFDRTCFLSNDTMTVFNTPPEDYVFVLDSTVTAGPTTLSLSCSDMSTPITCGGNVTGRTGTIDDIGSYPCAARALVGGEAFFNFTNPAQQDVLFGLSGVPAGRDLDVIVLAGGSLFTTGSMICNGYGDSVAVLPNLPAGEYVIVVDGVGPIVNVPFSLSASCGPSTLDCAPRPDVTCDFNLAGDTNGAPSTAYRYGTVASVFNGPERAYHFTNPVTQTVNFALSNPSDPRLDLILIKDCDPATVINWGDQSIVELNLPPGDYTLIVDGREGAAGTYKIVGFCGGTVRLEPPVLSTTIDPGKCYTEKKRLYFPTAPPLTDIMFSIDLSGSMGSELNQLKLNVNKIFTELSALIPSLAFGISMFNDAGGAWTDTVCGRSYSGGPEAFKINIPITTNIANVNAVLQAMTLPGGGTERYSYTWYKSYADPLIGWRVPCSRRLWITIGDEGGQDCNTLACIGGNNNNGQDPGDNLITGDADDVDFIKSTDGMIANGIILIFMDSSQNKTINQQYACLAGRTGGQLFLTDANGRLPPGSDIVKELSRVILNTLRGCPEVQLVPTGPNAAWVTVNPTGYPNVVTPFYGEFDVTFCVPGGTPPGAYSVPVEARCAGAGICDAEILGTQQVTINVPCPNQPLATAIAGPNPCVGSPVVLDAVPSTVSCGPGGVVYRWLEGTTPLCGWQPTTSCNAVPASTSVVYTLEVACASRPDCVSSDTVLVEALPYPDPALAPVLPICAGGTISLDASASNPNRCPVPLEYQFREGATIIRPWLPIDNFSPVAPPASGTYSVDVRCSASPGCEASVSIDVTVIPNPTAALNPATICAGATVTLDASASSSNGCPVPLEVQFLDPLNNVVQPWGPLPTYGPFVPPASGTYQVAVRCNAATPACPASTTATVTVVPAPTAVASPDVTLCKDKPVTLTGVASTGPACPGGLTYEWRQGATVVRPASTVADWAPPTNLPGATTYTLVVACASLPGCATSDDVVVQVQPCVLSVRYDRLEATFQGDGKTLGTVQVLWQTSDEKGSQAFQVQRSANQGGPFTDVGKPVLATGSGSVYRLTDEAVDPKALPWYHVVEYTLDETGDISEAVRPTLPRASGTTPAQDGRRRRGARK